MFAEIMLAIKSIQGILSAINSLGDKIDKLNLIIENKQLEEFKRETNEKLEQIKNAANDVDRKRLLVELSKQLQK